MAFPISPPSRIPDKVAFPKQSTQPYWTGWGGDFCCDFDTIKLSQLINERNAEMTQELTGKEFANLLKEYYNSYYQDRFQYVFGDLNCSPGLDVESLTNIIYNKVNGTDECIALLTTFGNNPSITVDRKCCKAFANYLHAEITR